MMYQGSSEKEPIGYISIDTKRDLLQEVAHEIIEDKKSHDLLSTSCRPRKARGVIQSKSTYLKTRGVDGVSPTPSPKALKPEKLVSESRRRQMSQLREQIHHSSAFLFYSGFHQIGCTGKHFFFFYQVYPFKC